MDIKYTKIKKYNFIEVIDFLINNLSDYKPKLKDYNRIRDSFFKQKNQYSIVAIYKKKIIGYGAIILEVKIRGSIAGHIEDVAVSKEFRKKGVGSKILKKLYAFAKKNKCYKISLQCKSRNINFYKKNKYFVNGTTMQILI